MSSPIITLPPELLEHVLWFLPTKDLLLAQQVSRQWQTLITKTARLQIALFRKKQPTKWCVRRTWKSPHEDTGEDISETWSVVKATDRDLERQVHDLHVVRDQNGAQQALFVEDRFPAGVVNDIFFEITTSDDWHEREIEVPRYHPRGSLNDGAEKRSDIHEYEHTGIKMSNNLLEAMHSPSTAWRDMYVSQPPAKHVSYDWPFRKVPEYTGTIICGSRNGVLRWPGVGLVYREGDIRSEDGVTVGQIADELLAVQGQLSGAEFSWTDVGRLSIHEFLWVPPKVEQQLRDSDDPYDDGADVTGLEGCVCLSFPTSTALDHDRLHSDL